MRVYFHPFAYEDPVFLTWFIGKTILSPGSVGKEPTLQCRCGFYLWAGNIPCSRKWQTTPVFLPWKFQGQRSLVGYSPWGRKRLGHSSVTKHIHPFPRFRFHGQTYNIIFYSYKLTSHFNMAESHFMFHHMWYACLYVLKLKFIYYLLN